MKELNERQTLTIVEYYILSQPESTDQQSDQIQCINFGPYVVKWRQSGHTADQRKNFNQINWNSSTCILLLLCILVANKRRVAGARLFLLPGLMTSYVCTMTYFIHCMLLKTPFLVNIDHNNMCQCDQLCVLSHGNISEEPKFSHTGICNGAYCL